MSGTDEPLRLRLSPANLAVAGLVGSVVVAVFPAAYAPVWSPRAFLYTIAVPAGVVALVRLVRSGDHPARWAASFLLVAASSALVSANPAGSMMTMLYRHESVVIFVATLGTWALARTRVAAGVAMIEHVFVGTVLLSTFAGVVQLVVGVRHGEFALIGSRASGLSLNPVYLGALSAGCVAWASAGLVESVTRWRQAIVVVASLGVWISGSRIALGAAVLATLVMGIRSFVPLLRFVVPAQLGGFVLGWVARSVSPGAGPDVAERLGSGAVSAGLGVRVEVWRFDLAAAMDRPMLGWGPGRHGNTIQGHYTASYVRRLNPDQLLNLWTDAHNVIVELLVVVGILGLLCAVGFVVSHRNVAHGPAAWAAATAALCWSMQPSGMVTLIPVAAMLGCASHRDVALPPLRLPAAAMIGLITGVVALWFVSGDTLLGRAERAGSSVDAGRGARVWFHDPVPAYDAAVFGLRAGLADPDGAGGADSLRWIVATTEREPDLAFWWVRRGDFELLFDRSADARQSYERALMLQPWSRAGARIARRPPRSGRRRCARLAELEARMAQLGVPPDG